MYSIHTPKSPLLCEGLFGLLVTMRCLPHAIELRHAVQAPKCHLHPDVLLKQLAVGDDGCNGMQELHPRRQRCSVCEQMHANGNCGG